MTSIFFRNMTRANRRPRASTICSGVALSLFIIIPMSMYTPSQSTSDFSTLDGDNREEMLAGQSNSFFLRKEYSLTKPYQGPWNLAGSAVITPDFVRLTPDSQSRSGAMWSRLPVHIRHWEVHLKFRIHGSTGHHFGDGLAFWYAEPAASKTAGRAFGGQEKFRGLAVFLDTYSNAHGPHSHTHPYVSAMVNNGSVEYDHEADGESVTTGCTARFRNREHETLVAIRYVDGTLTVSIDVDNKSGWQRCFRIRGVRLPTHYVFGVSAMTGDLSDNHDVMSMKVYEVESTLNPDDYSGDRKLIVPAIDGSAPESRQAPVPQESPSTGSPMLPVCLVLLAFAVLAGLAYMYRGRSQRSKKRFY